MKLEMKGYSHTFIDSERPQDIYTVHLYFVTEHYYSMYVCGPPRNGEGAYGTYVDARFSSIEEALEKFNDICEHIEDYVKEKIDD